MATGVLTDGKVEYKPLGKAIYCTKIGSTVTVELCGPLSDSVITPGGIWTVPNVTIPECCRPKRELYFFANSSGNSTDVPYLAGISIAGTVFVYTRDSSIRYFYGCISYVV